MSDEEHGPPTPRIVDLEAARQPWEKRKEESSEQWAAFQYYRDMHPRRIPRGSKFFGDIKANPWTVSRWCQQHDWVARVDAYDAMLDAITIEHNKRVVAETAESLTARGLNAALLMLEVSTLELEKYAEVARGGGGPGLIKPADLKGWLEASVKTIRLVRGETTENIGNGSEVYANLPLEAVRQLRVKHDADVAAAKKLAEEQEAEEEDEPSPQKKRFRAPG